ncbi:MULTISPECIES: hypothetical protein [Mucilaginibacter]|uniref:hypothetical protein n=1 Tax=Mucilaginibacter TaxID=423349 RepID=UPI00140C6B13|nr:MULTISPECIES: hypothetical protein [Mucilaginibacter]QTE35344.1 hypothetical protein J3L18_19600 [Mucilaginibacter gossypii]
MNPHFILNAALFQSGSVPDMHFVPVSIDRDKILLIFTYRACLLADTCGCAFVNLKKPEVV